MGNPSRDGHRVRARHPQPFSGKGPRTRPAPARRLRDPARLRLRKRRCAVVRSYRRDAAGAPVACGGGRPLRRKAGGHPGRGLDRGETRPRHARAVAILGPPLRSRLSCGYRFHDVSSAASPSRPKGRRTSSGSASSWARSPRVSWERPYWPPSARGTDAIPTQYRRDTEGPAPPRAPGSHASRDRRKSSRSSAIWLSLCIRSSILRTPCITVVWSRPRTAARSRAATA